jgi:RNA polymerase sigma factor (sigma-70 family)
MSYAEELALIQRCASGDEEAWADLLHDYGRFLDYIVRRSLSGGARVADPHRVLEVRDEVLAWLLENKCRVLKTYKGESKITSWLGVVVGRRARRIARRGQGLRDKTVSLDALTGEAATHLAVQAEPDSTPRQAALERLGEAIGSLSERDRALLCGAFYENRSYAELADELNVRTDSIGQLLFRAKKRLAKELGGEKFLETLSGSVLACLTWLVERCAV